MSRPLMITDCDEVLLHMVRHFGSWLDEAHRIDFQPARGEFANACRRQDTGAVLAAEEVWPLLSGFFATEMARQTVVPHAAQALCRIAAEGDVVVLTNLGEDCRDGRMAQLAAVGIEHHVVCNGLGPKGLAVQRLLEQYRPSAAVFVDDLGWHHRSVAETSPSVFRLHLIAEPTIAAQVPPAPEAHARIDDWQVAADWVLARFRGEPLPDTPAA